MFKQIQEQVERNRWIQKVQYALLQNVTTTFKRTKLLVVGKGGAGKTSTIRSLLTKDFKSEYDSTEVADANVQVSLLSTVDWKPLKEYSDLHLMESDFKEAVSRVKQDKSIETFASVTDLFAVPALSQSVVEVVSKSEMQHRNEVRSSKPMKGMTPKQTQHRRSTLLKSNQTKSTPFGEAKPLPEFSQQKNSITFTIWDFGGQEVFYHLHHLFLTRNGIYFAVFNTVLLLRNREEEVESLEFWAGALRLQAPEAPVAFVGTRAEAISQKELRTVDNILEEFCNEQDLNLMLNEQENLWFFPVENSLKEENERYLSPLKQRVHQELTDEQSSNKLHGFNEKINLSWIYVMDSFVREAKSHMSFKEMMIHCKRLGIMSEELEKLLTFYTEVGTILYFPPKTDERTALNEIAVLNPQWLLKALACFLYDIKLHKKNKFRINKRYRKPLARYETTGILYRSLLKHLWCDYQDEEVAFLELLSSNMLLTSKYVFDAEEIEGAIVDAKAYIVPAMLKDFEGEVLQALPDPADRFNASIRFDGPMPTGIFERFISEFVRKSGHFEGSQPPRLFRNFADFGFGSRFIYSALKKKTRTIELSTMRKDGDNHMRRVITFASEVVQRLIGSILGEAFGPTIFVQATKEDGILSCKLNDLWKAVENERKNVATISENGRRVSVTTETFSAFLREELELFQPPVKNKGDNRVVSMPKPTSEGKLFQEIRDKNYKYHAFLAHEWGTASRGHQTHEHVVAIKEELEMRGISTWIEEKNIHVCTMKEILKGFRSSRKVVVLLTRRYMERLTDPENEVTKQFRYGMDFRREDIIVVIMEKALLNPNVWFGPVAEFKLEEVCRIDFSNTTRMNQNFDKLVQILKL